MRINIKGNNPITSEQFKKVIDDLNAEYAPMGLKVKNMTCYVRFVDENGTTVEPIKNGNEIIKDITFKAVIKDEK